MLKRRWPGVASAEVKRTATESGLPDDQSRAPRTPESRNHGREP
jgi:hypothetical protein